MSEWKEYKLGEFVEIQTGPFGSLLHASDYVSIGTPSIMPTNIGNRLNIVEDDLVFVSDKDIERLKKYTVKEGDIVYSRRGDVEKCALITKEQEGWLCGTGCLRIRINKEGLSPQYCAYYLSTPEIKSWVLNSAVGTTMPNLNTTILNDLPLDIPNMKVQNQIVELLKSIDDKIDFLQKQNTLLEELGNILYRKLLNDNLDSLEEISILDFPGLYLLKPSIEKFEGEKVYLATADIKGKQIVNTTTKISYSNRPSRANMQPKLNSIWFAKMNDSIKNLLIDTNDISKINQYILSTGFYGLQVNQGLYFIWNFINSDDFVNQKQSNISGSVMEALNNDGLKSILIKIPQFEQIEKFENEVALNYKKIKKNQIQIDCLAKLRETILPKLMSGEIKVKE